MLASAGVKKTLLISMSVALGLAACTANVGDACEINTDCGRSMICERSLPEGYCTREKCEIVGCPSDGICIVFTEDLSYCMQPCEVDGDCRDGYSCALGFGGHPFCNDAAGVIPESVQ